MDEKEKAIKFIENTIRGLIIALQNKKEEIRRENEKLIDVLIEAVDILKEEWGKNEKERR